MCSEPIMLCSSALIVCWERLVVRIISTTSLTQVRHHVFRFAKWHCSNPVSVNHVWCGLLWAATVLMPHMSRSLSCRGPCNGFVPRSVLLLSVHTVCNLTILLGLCCLIRLTPNRLATPLAARESQKALVATAKLKNSNDTLNDSPSDIPDAKLQYSASPLLRTMIFCLRKELQHARLTVAIPRTKSGYTPSLNTWGLKDPRFRWVPWPRVPAPHLTTRLRRWTALLVGEHMNCASNLTSCWVSGWSEAW